MKTPQEQADRMAMKCADGLWEVGDGDKKDYMKLAPGFINDDLALRELIAVAMAVNEWNKSTPSESDKNVFRVDKILDALEALRKTGKAEL